METLYYSRMKSPVGPLLIGMSEKGLLALEFEDGLPSKLFASAASRVESKAHTHAVKLQLEEYFAGQRREFDLTLDLRGPEFYQRCWQQLLQIPYGQTKTYGEIARAIGCPAGFRAVGQANHHNPVAIIVPCHRVLASGGRLGGYGGGLPAKAWLLRLERATFREAASSSQQQLELTPS